MNRKFRLFVKKALNAIGEILPSTVKVGMLKAMSQLIADEYKIANQSASMFWHIKHLKNIGFSPTFVLDIGAYEGEWTEEVLHIFPNAQFLMIEAQQGKKYFKKICEEHPNVHTETALLGREKMDNVLFYELETGSSIYEENNSFPKKEVFLQMQTADGLVSEKLKPTDIVFAKIDVQGAELDVLSGMKGVLQQTEVVLLEVSLIEYNKNAPRFHDVLSYMDSIGFSVFDLCEFRRSKNLQLVQLDIFFVKKKFRS